LCEHLAGYEKESEIVGMIDFLRDLKIRCHTRRRREASRAIATKDL
jgi:hypothetical protein